MDLRRTNDGCLNCGGQKPAKVEKRQDGASIEYRCPDCDWKIVEGAVREHGDGGIDITTPRHPENEPTVANRVRVATWEKWWTGIHIVSAINGRVVAGEKKLYDFVRDLEESHDSS